MMNIRDSLLVRSLLSSLMAGCLFGAPCALAANTGTGNFKAVIAHGTCSVTLNGGQSSADVDLNEVYLGNVTADTELLTSDGQPQALDISCTGYPEAASRPSLKVSGSTVGTGGYPSTASLFRDAGKTGDNNNPSVSLGFQVQAAQANDPTPAWASIDYMVNDTGYAVMKPGQNADGIHIPLRFSMLCVPQSGKTVADCQQGGGVRAALTFSFDYE
jgi:type 1 fimbria pilin